MRWALGVLVGAVLIVGTAAADTTIHIGPGTSAATKSGPVTLPAGATLKISGFVNDKFGTDADAPGCDYDAFYAKCNNTGASRRGSIYVIPPGSTGVGIEQAVVAYPPQSAAHKYTVKLKPQYAGPNYRFWAHPQGAQPDHTYSGGFDITIVGAEEAEPCKDPAKPYTVRWSVQQAGVPDQGESPTLVGSTTGGSGTLTICSNGSPDPGGALHKAVKTTGTLLHVDNHELTPGAPGRSERIALKAVAGAYEKTAAARIVILLFKVAVATDRDCTVGEAAAIKLITSESRGNILTTYICHDKTHRHNYSNGERSTTRTPVKVVGRITVTAPPPA